ncbi:Undecaprenyl-diphosphatase [Deinococcus proteolyticus MRP]|uniref:Undecaprenyl-diphosphatase n=1 Tax=Deinococcus proteolyticus (strain ATCC 35074 / DSM 20540 / JCM 6276 / NBRC 101906 / NCIMB 13154 / VKM Ac-1939 / CCM 2703 / MRP) TaxID=693977 RepID=F0RJA1_DEIPM|nr:MULTISPECIES: undecaprenyl-diphosphate phosphatase [Deinococcus]ADY26538.1 Undecaprenyl-diphosphatase [Deinococcus proteolyticus MRP]MCY1702662.1 undecaprenyl-diphosphate phosphatase [Deinococcus sp. SL84]
MDWLYALVYGVVEGITEFLPISSTGHLIVTGHLMGVPWSKEVKDTFEVVIQGGAILAVLVYYWKDFVAQARALGQGGAAAQGTKTLWLGVLVACLPAAILGLAFSDIIKQYLFRPSVVAWALIVGGAIIWWLEDRRTQPTVHAIENIGVKRSLLIGAVQCLAMLWPGFSRSASSILGGMLTGLDRPTATKFSFYLGIPTLGGAALIDLVRSLDQLAEIGLGTVALGAVTSFAVAYLATGWLLRFVATNDFKPFAVYRIVVGALILALVYSGNLTNAV